MKKLFDSGDYYLKNSSWKDLAGIKFCLCSMGVLIGASLPEKYRKAGMAFAAGVFCATYVPLMAKYFTLLGEMNESA